MTLQRRVATKVGPDDKIIDVRPTLVIGMGGTGCRTMSWFHHLVRSTFGSVPPFLTMLALDSDALDDSTQTTQHAYPAADFFNVFESLRLGDILKDHSLNPEYHPHLRWLDDLDLPSAVTERGCQGISRLGRVVFSEAMQRTIYPAALERLSRMNSLGISRLVEAGPPRKVYRLTGGPVVHLISSLCGGTGSGMLLDMAYAIQAWTKEVFSHEAEVIGHLVLPEAFRVDAQQISDKLRAVACSMLEQIEYLMDHRRDEIQVEYPGAITRTFAKKNAPFTMCYLLNGQGPRGADSRDEIVEMIARTIQAMVLEPSGAALQSSANNMQLDILSQVDRKSKRLMFFSTYALTGGIMRGTDTDEQLSQLARRWLCQSLSQMNEKAEYDERRFANVGDDFKPLMPENFRAGQDLPSEQEVDWSPPRGEEVPSLDSYKSQVLAKNSKKINEYAKVRANSVLEKSLGEVIGNLRKRLQRSDIPFDPFAIVQGFRKEFEKLAAAWKTEANKSWDDSYRGIENALVELLADPYLPPDEIFASKLDQGRSELIRKIQEKAAETYRTKLFVRAAADVFVDYIRQELEKAIENITAVLNQLKGDASKEYLETNTSRSDDSTSPYLIPLAELEHPESRSLSESLQASIAGRTPESGVRSDERTQIDRAFQTTRSEFVELKRKVLAECLKAKKGENISIKDVLRDHQRALLEWISDYSRNVFNLMVRSSSPTALDNHLFSEAVRSIYEHSEPRISLNEKSRNHPLPMRLLISQQPKGTCFPQLLKQHQALDARATWIDDNYGQATGIYFQLMNFRFGFGLDSIASYDDYREAQLRYLGPTNFKRRDLWLDPQWLDKYERMLRHIDEIRLNAGQQSQVDTDRVRTFARDFNDKGVRRFFVELMKRAKSQLDCQREGMEAFGKIEKYAYHCEREIRVAAEKLDERFQTFPAIADPLMREVRDDLIGNYLKTRQPLFATTAEDLYREILKKCFDELRVEYDAGN